MPGWLIATAQNSQRFNKNRWRNVNCTNLKTSSSRTLKCVFCKGLLRLMVTPSARRKGFTNPLSSRIHFFFSYNYFPSKWEIIHINVIQNCSSYFIIMYNYHNYKESLTWSYLSLNYYTDGPWLTVFPLRTFQRHDGANAVHIQQKPYFKSWAWTSSQAGTTQVMPASLGLQEASRSQRSTIMPLATILHPHHLSIFHFHYSIQ